MIQSVRGLGNSVTGQTAGSSARPQSIITGLCLVQEGQKAQAIDGPLEHRTENEKSKEMKIMTVGLWKHTVALKIKLKLNFNYAFGVHFSINILIQSVIDVCSHEKRVLREKLPQHFAFV
jgi:hypothetical protein